MIVFDTETTGTPKPMSVALDQQPEILEFAAVKLADDTLEEIQHISFFVKPRMFPLPEQVTKFNGITSDMVKDAPSFARHVPVLSNFFLGERVAVAHNIGFDITIMVMELMRLDRVNKFPWPPEQLCTVELSMDLDIPRQKSDRLKLSELYRHITGEDPPVKHRALDDVRTLVTVVRWLRKLDGRL